MQKLFIPALNTLTLVLTIFFNYWAAIARFNGVRVEDVSATYYGLYYPADYVFFIWGLIYLGMVALLSFQWFETLTGRNGGEITGIWLTITNVANSLWIYAWIHQMVGLSVIFMFFLLMSLLRQVVLFNMECWDAPPRIVFFVWWPLGTYLGLIIISMFVMIVAFLERQGWNGGPIGPEWWAIVLILVTGAVYISLIFKRNMRETAIVGAWTIAGIAVKQWEKHPFVAYLSIIVSFLMMAAVVWHGYKNRKYSIFAKLSRNEF